MMLGNQECDAETAYYLKHSTKPEYKYNCTASPPDCNWEKAYEPRPLLLLARYKNPSMV